MFKSNYFINKNFCLFKAQVVNHILHCNFSLANNNSINCYGVNCKTLIFLSQRYKPVIPVNKIALCNLSTSTQRSKKPILLKIAKPSSSLVLSSYLRQRNLPPWTSYFVKYKDIVSDQRGQSHFNWQVEGINYHILRTGCWPYIKYHCTRRPYQDLRLEDCLFRGLKVVNFGLPCLAYGAAATFLITCDEDVVTPIGTIKIYFLYPEERGARY